jgi:hypothetical protein
VTTEEIIAQINRYFQAAYGPSYVYRAPETFNKFEQWMQAVAADNKERAEELMSEIEAHLR